VQGRRITVKSEPLQLQIESRPAASTGSDWQPARSLSLSQQISGTDALRVGEPVTRTVIIDAVGLEENMIAEPAWPELPGARIYPDQPQGISRDNGEWVLGHKEFRYAVVPEQEGELLLPELTVHWWDTVNDRQQIAVLPAQTLHVRPSELVPPPPARMPGASSETTALREQPAPTSAPGAAIYWRWLTLLFAGLWFLTLLLFWRSRGRAGGFAEPVRAAPADEVEILDGVRRACERGDAAAARLGLRAWLREFGPDATRDSLLEFAAMSGDPSLRDGIYELDSRGFRQETAEQPLRSAAGVWAGRAFWSQFENWRTSWRAQELEQKPPLTDLYARANRVT
jgi:hypothetical protein